MKAITKNLAVIVPMLIFGQVTPMQAQVAPDTAVSVAIPENAQERIHISGMLRVLSQQIPAAACHLGRGSSTDNAAAIMTQASTQFEGILTALEFGDEALNIVAPETRRKTLVRIHALREVWQPFDAAARTVSAGNGTDADLDYLLTANLEVLSVAQLLVEELTQQYANPNALTQASAMLIDISARQAMLTQKISKEACMIGSIYETPETRSNLAGSVQIFESSLEALRFGMPEVGILPPLNAEVAEALQLAYEDWNGVKPMISDVLAGGAIEPQEQAEKAAGLAATMNSLGAVVDLYSGQARPNA